MVELEQMTGTDNNGCRHVYQTDRVYRVIDDRRRQIGFVDRKEGARFAAIIALTDDERDSIVGEINATREKQGKFGPIAGPGEKPSDTPLVNRELAKMQQESEDDAE